VAGEKRQLPEKLAHIERLGYVVFNEKGAGLDIAGRCSSERIPVAGIRHLRIWGIQVDDERELPGHERTAIDDEENWQVILIATDGSHYEVNSDFVEPAPE